MDPECRRWILAPRLAESIFLCLVVVIASGTVAVAQSEANKIATLERARVAAIKAGRNLSTFYSPVFFNIRADGGTENVQQTGKVAEGSAVKLDDAFVVRVYRVAAVVTGVEWLGDPPVPHRFLRIWTGLGNPDPKIAIVQLTAITGQPVPGVVLRPERSVMGPVRPSNPPCHGIRGALDSDLQRDELFDKGDLVGYGSLTAPEFVYVDGTGRAIERAEYLRARSGSHPANSKITRGRQFKACDLAVLFIHREEVSGIGRHDLIELETRVLAGVGGIWRQVAAQITPVREASSR